jgi:hypothetical protein
MKSIIITAKTEKGIEVINKLSSERIPLSKKMIMRQIGIVQSVNTEPLRLSFCFKESAISGMLSEIHIQSYSLIIEKSMKEYGAVKDIDYGVEFTW